MKPGREALDARAREEMTSDNEIEDREAAHQRILSRQRFLRVMRGEGPDGEGLSYGD